MHQDEERISDQIDGGQLAMKEAEKQQTAMMELIDRLKYLSIEHDDAGLRTAKDIATELLEKERKQIATAYERPFKFRDNIGFSGEEYYEQTFKA